MSPPPPPPPPPIAIRTAHPPDFPAMLAMDLQSNATHPVYTIPFRACAAPAAALESFIRDRYTHLYESRNPSSGFLVATTRTAENGGGEEEEVVGYLIYLVGKGGGGEKGEWKPRFAEGTDLGFFEMVFGETGGARKGLDLEGCWELEGFAVHPKWQRRGVGSMLVKRFLETVDAEHAKCYVHASRSGKALYEKFGFGVLGMVSVDLKEFGDYEAYVTWDMKREAV